METLSDDAIYEIIKDLDYNSLATFREVGRRYGLDPHILRMMRTKYYQAYERAMTKLYNIFKSIEGAMRQIQFEAFDHEFEIRFPNLTGYTTIKARIQISSRSRKSIKMSEYIDIMVDSSIVIRMIFHRNPFMQDTGYSDLCVPLLRYVISYGPLVYDLDMKTMRDDYIRNELNISL